MKRFINRTLFLTTTLLVLSSCAKEEFSPNKAVSKGDTSSAITTSAQLCAQSTLIRPQVDVLMLWDNTSSFNFVTSATKASMSNLISSVSENFDYHILSAPLVPANAANLYESQLVVKNSTGLGSDALSIVRTKENAIASLGFSQGNGSAEAGVDRAYNMIVNNRSNGIFRTGAYTIIVVISNEDDKYCGMDPETNPSKVNCTSSYDYDRFLAPRINRFLTLRANSSVYPYKANLDSSMMRFINISPLTSCASGNYKMNYVYRKMAKTMYEAPYTNGWPTSNDHLSPDVIGAPDSYNLCSIDFSHIFDGVNTAIKQTLLKHKYDYWPVAGSSTAVDPDTIRVYRSDGKLLTNRTGESNPSDGFAYIGVQSNRATRYYPTSGETFTGKMIQLFGVEGNDKIVYPDCLTVTYTEPKATYGYVYLANGKPNVSTIQLKINNATVPESATNGWSYAGLSMTDALDQNVKTALLPAGTSSGYFLRLNGNYRVQNNTSNSFAVYYISAP